MNVEFDPHGRVEIESTRYDTWRDKGLVTGISVELCTDKSAEAVITIVDEEFKWTDRHVSPSGMQQLKAVFWLGFGEKLGLPLFKGTLARCEHDGTIASFHFHDASTRMKQERKVRYHNKQSVLQILKKLAADNGLSFSGPEAGADTDIYDSLIQKGETDWAFARRIASRAGYVMWVSDENLFVQEAGNKGTSVAALKYHTHFEMLHGSSFSYKLPENKRGRSRRTSVHGRARDDRKLSGEEAAGARGTTHVIVNEDLPKHSMKEATRRAKGHSQKKREHAFEHEIRSLPDFRKRIGCRETITLEGLGAFYSGDYIVDSIRYEYAPGALTQEMRVFRDIKT